MKNQRIIEGLQSLNEKGLTLISVLDTQTLPSSLKEGISEQEIALDEYPRLVVLANGGGNLWKTFSADRPVVEHPLDHYSIQITSQFFESFLPHVPNIRLYPQAHQLPIQQLSRFAGWSFPSPLGMDIHPEFGLWYAYRAIYLVGSELPLFNDAYTKSPCDDCKEKPCFPACPSGAVQGIEKFDTSKCIPHRLTKDSECAETCLARLACPIGLQHQYSAEQISFHYLYSLHAYQRYYAEQKTSP
jgi:epoxyqueuosine reductase